jgi:hypothetical protein
LSNSNPRPILTDFEAAIHSDDHLDEGAARRRQFQFAQRREASFCNLKSNIEN